MGDTFGVWTMDDTYDLNEEPSPTWHEMVTALAPAWRECPYCKGFHPKGSEC